MMVWIASFVSVAALLIATGLINRIGVALPVLAMIVMAAAVSTDHEARPIAGLKPSLDAPGLYSATELKADSNGHYFAKADINGTTIAVMVDTGASGVALSYEDAERVGLRPHGLDYDLPINTANGVVKAARVKLRRVEVDNVRVRDVEGMVLPEGALRGSLLGMSFLSRLSSFRIENGVLYLKD
ncbi:MAG: TIGR02281 family clan AA aspartic protease [Parvibaculaceae bacterium]